MTTLAANLIGVVNACSDAWAAAQAEAQSLDSDSFGLRVVALSDEEVES